MKTKSKFPIMFISATFFAVFLWFVLFSTVNSIDISYGRNCQASKFGIFVLNKPNPIRRIVLTVAPEEVEFSDFPDTPRGEIRRYIYEICQDYPNVDPLIIEAQVFEESRYISSVVGGGGAWVGLMQISPKWHRDRMERLGVTDLFDPYSNLLVGIDYMSELIDIYHDKVLALMVYNGSASAYSKWENGQISSYAQNVMNNVYILKNGGELNG